MMLTTTTTENEHKVATPR